MAAFLAKVKRTLGTINSMHKLVADYYDSYRCRPVPNIPLPGFGQLLVQTQLPPIKFSVFPTVSFYRAARPV